MKSKSLQISLLAILLGAFFTAFSPEISAKGNTKNTSSSLEWYSRGPQNIGGSVRAILIDQQDASQQTLIIGSEAGGIWMSTDGGTNWNPINYEKNLFVTSLTQTDNGDIFIGTGGDYQGSGLYKMSGSTITPINDSEWSSINDLASKENNVYIASSEGLKYYDGNTFTTCTADGVSLEGVATEVQVNEGGKIIAVVEKTCYISNSSFDAFVNHSTGEANQLPLPNVTGSLAITSDNMNDNLFYASVVKTTGVLHSILISTDGGNNWEVILQGGGSIDPFVLDKVKYGLVHNKIISINSMEGNNAVFVGGRDLWFGFRPINGTGFFDFGTQSVTSSYLSPYNSTYYLHSMVYDVAFKTASNAYLATDGGIFSTQNFIPNGGGIAFTKHNVTLSNLMVNSVHADGNDHILCGTEQSAVVMIGKNTNANTLANPVWTIGSATNFYALEGTSKFNYPSLINKDFLILSLSDNESFSFRRSDDNGYSFTDIVIPDNKTTVDHLIYWETFDAKYPTDTVVFYALEDTDSTASTHYNNWAPGDVVWGYSTHKYNTTDGYPIPYVLDRQLEVGDSVLIPDVIQSRTFASIEKAVYMSDEILNVIVTTPSWEKLFTLTENVSTLAISANCEDLYVGTVNGKVYRVDQIDAYYVDTTLTYEPILIADFESQAISSISIDPQNKEHVIVTLSTTNSDTYIYQSNNATSESPSFSSIQHNLPAVSIYTSIIPKNGSASSNNIVVGTENGLYTLEGSSWTKDEVLGDIKITDLSQQNLVRIGHSVPMRNPNPGDSTNPFIYQSYPASVNNGCLYVSTFGKSVYQSDFYKTDPVVVIPENPINETSSAILVYPNPVSFSTNVEIEAETAQQGIMQIYDIQGRCIATQDIFLQAGKNINTIDFSNYNDGVYLIRVVYGQNSKTAKVIKSL